MAWAVTVMIVVLSLIHEVPATPFQFGHSDKLSHAFAFFVWASCAATGWSWRFATGLALAMVFGATIEALQPLTGRGFELADLGADLFGAALGLRVGQSLREWRLRALSVRRRA